MKGNEKMKKIITNIAKTASVIGVVGGTCYLNKKSCKKVKRERDKLFMYYQLLGRWIQNNQEKVSIMEYFKENDIKKIAIYGAGQLGQLLYDELKDTEVEIKYFIDQQAENLNMYCDEKVVTIKEVPQQETVDAIIVTAYYFFDDILKELDKSGVDIDIISLEDIIYA